MQPNGVREQKLRKGASLPPLPNLADLATLNAHDNHGIQLFLGHSDQRRSRVASSRDAIFLFLRGLVRCLERARTPS